LRFLAFLEALEVIVVARVKDDTLKLSFYGKALSLYD
jgi:hypothetical protein